MPNAASAALPRPAATQRRAARARQARRGSAARSARRSWSTSRAAATSSSARVAELQWDLGGLVYEMAIRDRIRVDVLVKRAAALQDADAELSEVERILRMEETGAAGVLRLLRRAPQQRRRLLLAVRQPAARAGPGDAIGASSRRSLGRSAEAAGHVVARARVARLGEDRLGVVELDQHARRGRARSSRG